MSEGIVASHAVLVGPGLVNVVLDFAGRYVLYLEIGGTANEVQRISAAVHSIVVSDAATPTIDLDWDIKVSPNYFKVGELFSVYCVKPTSALTGELVPAEVST